MANELYQRLLPMLMASDADRRPAIEALLQQMGSDDPAVQLIAQYLSAQAAEEDDDADFDDEDRLDRPRSQTSRKPNRSRAAGSSERARRLRKVVQTMHEQLEELRQRNDELSAALGACPLCWGGDSQCEACDGNGLPGSSMPDKALFAQYVAPVVQRIQQQKRGG